MTPTKGRYRQLIRCLRMVRERSYQLDTTPEHLQALATRHRVTTRTIRRDLQALREAGYGFVRFTEVDIPGDIAEIQERETWLNSRGHHA